MSGRERKTKVEESCSTCMAERTTLDLSTSIDIKYNGTHASSKLDAWLRDIDSRLSFLSRVVCRTVLRHICTSYKSTNHRIYYWLEIRLEVA